MTLTEKKRPSYNLEHYVITIERLDASRESTFTATQSQYLGKFFVKISMFRVETNHSLPAVKKVRVVCATWLVTGLISNDTRQPFHANVQHLEVDGSSPAQMSAASCTEAASAHTWAAPLRRRRREKKPLQRHEHCVETNRASHDKDVV